MTALRKRNFKAYTATELFHEWHKYHVLKEEYPEEWKKEIEEEMERRKAKRDLQIEEGMKAKDALLAKGK